MNKKCHVYFLHKLIGQDYKFDQCYENQGQSNHIYCDENNISLPLSSRNGTPRSLRPQSEISIWIRKVPGNYSTKYDKAKFFRD